jgi:hypothetical protein
MRREHACRGYVTVIEGETVGEGIGRAALERVFSFEQAQWLRPGGIREP